jgi:hypothetical protein
MNSCCKKLFSPVFLQTVAKKCFKKLRIDVVKSMCGGKRRKGK